MSVVSRMVRHRRAGAAARLVSAPPSTGLLAYCDEARQRQRRARRGRSPRDGGALHRRTHRCRQHRALRGARRPFFAQVLGPNRNTPRASTRSRPRRCRRPRKKRCARPSSTPISSTGNRSSNSAAAGVRCRCGWRGNFRCREITAVSNSQSQRHYIEARRRRAD